MKQVALIYFDEKLVYAVEVRELESVGFLELKRQAEQNLKEYVKQIEKAKDEIRDLKQEIELLKEEIKVLKGEE